jgi:hypothetical protein
MNAKTRLRHDEKHKTGSKFPVWFYDLTEQERLEFSLAIELGASSMVGLAPEPEQCTVFEHLISRRSSEGLARLILQ